METAITIGLAMLGLYLAVGVGVAAWLHAGRLRRMDGSVAGAGWVFRVLITPGLVALWPVLLRRSAEYSRTGGVSSPYEAPVRAVRLIVLQRLGTQLLAVLAPIALVAILLARPPEPRLSAAEAALTAGPAAALQAQRFPWDEIEARWTLDAEGRWEITVSGKPTDTYKVELDAGMVVMSSSHSLTPESPSTTIRLGRFEREGAPGSIVRVYVWSIAKMPEGRSTSVNFVDMYVPAPINPVREVSP